MSRIQEKVMASVLVIHWARRALSARALKLYALVAAGVSVAALVSVKSVISNLMAVGLDGLGEFAYAAIANTTPAVQISTVVAVIMALLLVRDVAVPARRFA